MTTASPDQQRRLLDVQELDTQLARLAHEKSVIPELAQLAQTRALKATLDAARIAAQTEAADLARALAKAEADVEQVRARAARNQARLDSGSVTAKDAQALLSENELLTKRQSDLEDVELEAMEASEAADARAASAVATLGETTERESELAGVVGAAGADLDRQSASVAAERAAAADGVEPALLAVYEKIRSARAGRGVARLVGNRCEGCRTELSPVELSRIRAMAADQIARCEECGRILVREG